MYTQIDPENGSISFTYDVAGNLLTKTDRNGTLFNYTNDALGRVWKIHATPAGGSKTLLEEHAYTRMNAPRRDTNDTLTVDQFYDDRGNLIKVTESDGIEKNYTYDLDNNRLSSIIKKNGVITNHTVYTYDILGRMTTVKENGAPQATYTYDANGNRASVTYANGAQTSYTYNRANLVTGVYNGKKNNSTAYGSYTYTYQLDGNQRTKTDKNGTTTAYSYDKAGRLWMEAVTPLGAAQALTTDTYTYDDYGNRDIMFQNGVMTEHFYDRRNRLTRTYKSDGIVEEETLYTYDANGNELTKAVEIIEPGNSSYTEQFSVLSNTSYAQVNRYDLQNRLIESISTNDTVSYTYRPDGLRYDKTTDGEGTRHIWDGSSIVGDLSVSQSGEVELKAGYVRGIGLIAQKDIENNGYNYYLFNGHGDTTGLLNSDGAILWSYDYTAFGVEKDVTSNQNHAQPDNPFRYCAEYYDTETETIYLRARYYNPVTARFSAEDPVGNGLNWYTYLYDREDILRKSLVLICFVVI